MSAAFCVPNRHRSPMTTLFSTSIHTVCIERVRISRLRPSAPLCALSADDDLCHAQNDRALPFRCSKVSDPDQYVISLSTGVRAPGIHRTVHDTTSAKQTLQHLCDRHWISSSLPSMPRDHSLLAPLAPSSAVHLVPSLPSLVSLARLPPHVTP
ncbi:hypothetical protein CC85DRAFT_197075 [Cutaneotrichosporon oleaginosum]|uniref:Uncharacterized protein n=1 Tax=Cutaneotrichosporon oleaginosum TaxID=879819 RepID=A0A0J0XE46_9TREE|nr:uncharacterized protein CC85DRAFT_197075 [Cutaneotrichosporon oleaginosum]KLT39352.1 hypothetical protein CC85DRAFT_197075 [Cutaneotrichosporon oleaginosum]TXT12101.1 hypothetical protein COLE_02511 [Cutaneotrichosporon oleaginosum]